MSRAKSCLVACAIALLCLAPAEAQDAYELWHGGKYEEAVASGLVAGTPAGATVAARAALSLLMLHVPPCLDCVHRAEQLARDAIKANPGAAAARIYLAVALGYEARLIGAVQAARAGLAGQAKSEVDRALAADPANAQALATLGGWHIDTVRIAGAFLAGLAYGATLDDGLAKFSKALELAPDDPVIAYQFALELASYDSARYRARIESALARAAAAPPHSEFERATVKRAAELLTLLQRKDGAAFAHQVRRDMGIAH